MSQVWNRFWNSFACEERWCIVVCAALLVFLTGMSRTQRNMSHVMPPLFVDAPPAVASTRSTSGSAVVLVHVAGEVRRPGLQRLAKGSRVADAVREAGGGTAQADIHALNLVARLQDGQRIELPRKGSAPALATAEAQDNRQRQAGRPESLLRGPINVNTAGASELEALPGVGPAIAARIVEHRAQHGRFNSMNDLDAVKGLGPKKLEKLQPVVTF